MSHDGTAKICDFGLARAKYKTFLSTKHVDVGTFAYMWERERRGDVPCMYVFPYPRMMILTGHF